MADDTQAPNQADTQAPDQAPARPMNWVDVANSPEYQQLTPEKQLATFGRWHDSAYNYASTQPGWETTKDQFNQKMADQQKDLGEKARAYVNGESPDLAHYKRLAGIETDPMTPAEASYHIAQAKRAADPNATLTPDLQDALTKGPPDESLLHRTALGSLISSGVRNILPTQAGLVGAAKGAEIGAGVAAAIPVVGETGVGELIGGGIGGLIGFGLAQWGAKKVQDAVANNVAPGSVFSSKVEQDQAEAHPWSSEAGSLLALGKPNPAKLFESIPAMKSLAQAAISLTGNETTKALTDFAQMGADKFAKAYADKPEVAKSVYNIFHIASAGGGNAMFSALDQLKSGQLSPTELLKSAAIGTLFNEPWVDHVSPSTGAMQASSEQIRQRHNDLADKVTAAVDPQTRAQAIELQKQALKLRATGNNKAADSIEQHAQDLLKPVVDKVNADETAKPIPTVDKAEAGIGDHYFDGGKLFQLTPEGPKEVIPPEATPQPAEQPVAKDRANSMPDEQGNRRYKQGDVVINEDAAGHRVVEQAKPDQELAKRKFDTDKLINQESDNILLNAEARDRGRPPTGSPTAHEAGGAGMTGAERVEREIARVRQKAVTNDPTALQTLAEAHKKASAKADEAGAPPNRPNKYVDQGPAPGLYEPPKGKDEVGAGQREKTNPHDLVPALQTADNGEYKGEAIPLKAEQTHAQGKTEQFQEAMKSGNMEKAESLINATHGFIDKNNPDQFLSRDEASDKLGRDVAPQALHSETLHELQANTPKPEIGQAARNTPEDRASTRWPFGDNSENPHESVLEEHPDYIKDNPKEHGGQTHAQVTADILRGKKGFRASTKDELQFLRLPKEVTTGTDQEVIEKAIEFFKDNKLALYNRIKDMPWFQRASKQYVGYNVHGHNLESEYGVPAKHIFVAESAMSPQRSPETSFAMTETLLKLKTQDADKPWDDAMTKAAKNFNTPIKTRDLARLKGKTYNDLTSPLDKAKFARAYAEAHYPNEISVITPEGERGGLVKTDKGETARIQWPSWKQISKGVEGLEGRPASELLTSHKIASYFNNKVVPEHDFGDVTSDTHDARAGFLSPFDSKGPEMAAHFGGPIRANTGQRGLYSLQSEAGRRAAKEVGMLPQELQAGLWTGAQGYMSPDRLSNKAVAEIRGIWEDASVGKISAHEAQQEALDTAFKDIGDKQVVAPWAREERPGNASTAGQQASGNAEELSGRGGPAGEPRPGDNVGRAAAGLRQPASEVNVPGQRQSEGEIGAAARREGWTPADEHNSEDEQRIAQLLHSAHPEETVQGKSALKIVFAKSESGANIFISPDDSREVYVDAARFAKELDRQVAEGKKPEYFAHEALMEETTHKGLPADQAETIGRGLANSTPELKAAIEKEYGRKLTPTQLAYEGLYHVAMKQELGIDRKMLWQKAPQTFLEHAMMLARRILNQRQGYKDFAQLSPEAQKFVTEQRKIIREMEDAYESRFGKRFKYDLPGYEEGVGAHLKASGPETIKRDLGRNDEHVDIPSDARLKEILTGEGKDISGNIKADKVGAARNIPDGTRVGVRIDIPAFKRSGQYAQTIHDVNRSGGISKVLGYDGIVTLDNPTFYVSANTPKQIEALKAVKEGGNKFPLATADGAYNKSREIPKDINDWTPVGFDPKEHAFFYDKRTDEMVTGGEKAVMVGNTAFVKNPTYGDRSKAIFGATREDQQAQSDEGPVVSGAGFLAPDGKFHPGPKMAHEPTARGIMRQNADVGAGYEQGQSAQAHIMDRGYVRVTTEPGKMFIEGNPSASQLRILKDSAIEKNVELIHDIPQGRYNRTQRTLYSPGEVGGASREEQPEYASQGREVSPQELNEIKERGRQRLAIHQATGQATEGLQGDKWEQAKDSAFKAAQTPWEGATIDPRTGEAFKPEKAESGPFAVSSKKEGQNTIRIPATASQEDFNAAMEKAKAQFPQLADANHYLGVFHDAKLGTIDIDPVVIAKSTAEAEEIGAHTKAVGGAYDYATGNGLFPPRVAGETPQAPAAQGEIGAAKRPMQVRAVNGKWVEEPQTEEAPAGGGMASAIREQRMPGQVQTTTPMDKEQLQAIGEGRLAKGEDPQAVLDAYKKSGNFAAKPEDIALFNAQARRLQAATDAAKASGDNATAEKAFSEERSWAQQLAPFQKAWHEMGVGQQSASNDLSNEYGMKREFADRFGKDMTEQQEKQAAKPVKGVQEANAAIDKAVASMDKAVGPAQDTGAVPKDAKGLADYFNQRKGTGGEFIGQAPRDPAVEQPKALKFTPEEVKRIWDFSKPIIADLKTYGDVSRAAEHVSNALNGALTPDEVRAAWAQPKRVNAPVAKELFEAMGKRKAALEQARSFLDRSAMTGFQKVMHDIIDFPRSLAILGHANPLITHAGRNLFTPEAWSNWGKAFVQQFKFLVDPAAHEVAMQRILEDPLYQEAKLAGLRVSPYELEDYSRYNKVLGQMLGGRVAAVGRAGNRAMDALKVFRMEMYKQNMDNVASGMQGQDRVDASKFVAAVTNHISGYSNNFATRFFKDVGFAPGLEGSRWAFIGDYKRALQTTAKLATGQTVSAGERAQAKLVSRRAAQFVGVMGSAMLANYALAKATGQEDDLPNFHDPTQTDFMRFKWNGKTLDPTGGLFQPVRLLSRLVAISQMEKGERQGAAFKELSDYASGKANPGLTTAIELGTGQDAIGRALPGRESTTTKEPYSVPEYLATKAPIPLSETAKNIYDSIAEQTDDSTAQKIMTGLTSMGFGILGVKQGKTPGSQWIPRP